MAPRWFHEFRRKLGWLNGVVHPRCWRFGANLRMERIVAAYRTRIVVVEVAGRILIETGFLQGLRVIRAVWCAIGHTKWSAAGKWRDPGCNRSA